MKTRLPELFLLLLFPALVHAEALALFTVGEASDIDTGELLYREVHMCSADRVSCEVHYRRPDGQLIARKTLDYGPRAYGPAVLAQDLRSGKEQVIPPLDDPDVVVDAGFDNYVRLRWDELEQGKRVKFPLRLLALDSPVKMRAQIAESGCPEDQLCIEVEVDSWLLGLVAGPIKLRYARDDRSLLHFAGVSNLKDDEGDSQEVVIRYDYDPMALARALPDEITPDLP